MLLDLHGDFCLASSFRKVKLQVPHVSKPVAAGVVREVEQEEEEEEEEEEEVVVMGRYREVEEVRSSTAACRAGRPSRVAFIFPAARSSSAQMQISVTCPLSRLCM